MTYPNRQAMTRLEKWAALESEKAWRDQPLAVRKHVVQRDWLTGYQQALLDTRKSMERLGIRLG